MRARLNFNAGHPERGLEDLDALLSIDTRSPKVLTLHAECLAASGKPQAADDFLSAAMDGAVDATKLKAKRAELREKHGAKGKKQKKSAG